MQIDNNERLDNLVCNNITINSGTLDSSVTVLGSPSPHEVASKGYVRELLAGGSQGGDLRPVITVSLSSIHVSEFKLFDSKRDFVMYYGGGYAEALNLSIFSLNGIDFLYVYAVSNGDVTKAVVTAKLESPAGFKYSRRLACIPINGGALMEGVQYDKDFFLKQGVLALESNETPAGSRDVKIKYIPSAIPVQANIGGHFGYQAILATNLLINNTVVAYTHSNASYGHAQGYTYSGLAIGGVMTFRTNAARTYYSIYVSGYKDLTL